MGSGFRPIYKWIVFCCFFAICLLFLPQQKSDGPSPKFRALQPVTTILDDSEDTNDSNGFQSDGTDGTDVSDVTALPLYFVESSKCKIPYVDPFGADAMAIYKPMVYEPCSNDTALVTPIYDVIRRRYVLHINETLASLLLKSSEIEYNCYYQEIKGSSSDGYDSVDRKYFSQDYVVPVHVQGLILGCHRIDNTSHILQSDAYTLVQYKAPPPGLFLEPSKRKPSVIMFGIDSLSRINLRRTMPKVYNFLTRSGWYELQGYNKFQIALFQYDRGNWLPTIYIITVKDFCKVMYDKNYYWYTYWTKYVINKKDVESRCFMLGTKLLMEEYKLHLVLNIGSAVFSGLYKAIYTIEAYSALGVRRPTSFCFEVRGEFKKVK
ncbi:GL13794 [Drosophila persimilis]|uniref:GL13794 n=1 Tax=Drosophila persimilis TaxID=7234 RepID=B4GP06_DROPE|nr:GL13794 [Drosophila persimilis]